MKLTLVFIMYNVLIILKSSENMYSLWSENSQ